MKQKLIAIALAVALSTPIVAIAQSTTPRHDDVRPIKETGFRQKDLVNLLKALRNRVFCDPDLTYGSGSPGLLRIQVGGSGDCGYMIDGVLYSKAAADDIASSISGTALTNTQEAIFRVEIDTTGAITSVQGAIVTNSSCSSRVAPTPPRTASKATLGTVRVCRYTFTPGTTTLNNAAVTFVDGDPDLLDLLEK